MFLESKGLGRGELQDLGIRLSATVAHLEPGSNNIKTPRVTTPQKLPFLMVSITERSPHPTLGYA
jgi:hypothetical protein